MKNEDINETIHLCLAWHDVPNRAVHAMTISLRQYVLLTNTIPKVVSDYLLEDWNSYYQSDNAPFPLNPRIEDLTVLSVCGAKCVQLIHRYSEIITNSTVAPDLAHPLFCKALVHEMDAVFKN